MEIENEMPRGTWNRFAKEFCVPQRGQTAVADVQPSNRWNKSAAGKIIAQMFMLRTHRLRPSKDISRDRTFGGRNGCAENPARHFRRPGGSTAYRTRTQDSPRGDPEAESRLVRVERRERTRRSDRARRPGGERHEPPPALRI